MHSSITNSLFESSNNIEDSNYGSRKKLVAKPSASTSIRPYEKESSRGLFSFCNTCTNDATDYSANVTPKIEQRQIISQMKIEDSKTKGGYHMDESVIVNQQTTVKHIGQTNDTFKSGYLNEYPLAPSLVTTKDKENYTRLMMNRLKKVNLSEYDYEKMIITPFLTLTRDENHDNLRKLMTVVNKPDFIANFKLNERQYNQWSDYFHIPDSKRNLIYSDPSTAGFSLSSKSNQDAPMVTMASINQRKTFDPVKASFGAPPGGLPQNEQFALGTRDSVSHYGNNRRKIGDVMNLNGQGSKQLIHPNDFQRQSRNFANVIPKSVHDPYLKQKEVNIRAAVNPQPNTKTSIPSMKNTQFWTGEDSNVANVQLGDTVQVVNKEFSQRRSNDYNQRNFRAR